MLAIEWKSVSFYDIKNSFHNLVIETRKTGRSTPVDFTFYLIRSDFQTMQHEIHQLGDAPKSLDLTDDTLQVLAFRENSEDWMIRRLAQSFHNLHIAPGVNG